MVRRLQMKCFNSGLYTIHKRHRERRIAYQRAYSSVHFTEVMETRDQYSLRVKNDFFQNDLSKDAATDRSFKRFHSFVPKPPFTSHEPKSPRQTERASPRAVIIVTRTRRATVPQARLPRNLHFAAQHALGGAVAYFQNPRGDVPSVR